MASTKTDDVKVVMADDEAGVEISGIDHELVEGHVEDFTQNGYRTYVRREQERAGEILYIVCMINMAKA